MADVPPSERREVLRAYVARCLARAEQFHRALDVPAKPPPGTTLHLFAGDRYEMPYRVLIDRTTGRIERIDEAWGDDFVTRRSALADENEFRDLRQRVQSPTHWSSVHFVSGDHLEMLGEATLVDNLLYLLLRAPVPSVSKPGARTEPSSPPP